MKDMKGIGILLDNQLFGNFKKKIGLVKNEKEISKEITLNVFKTKIVSQHFYKWIIHPKPFL